MLPHRYLPSVARSAGSGMPARVDAAQKSPAADTAERPVKSGFLWPIYDTVNRATIRIAGSGRGPFTLVRRVGPNTGTTHKTPIIVPRSPTASLPNSPTGTKSPRSATSSRPEVA